MPDQPPTMPPQSPVVNQQTGFAPQQQQHQWQHSQYHQYGQRGMPPNQTNSNPPTPHPQMPPPNLIQQQTGQPHSPIVSQMNPQMNQQMGIVPRNQINHQANFGHPQFMHSQFGPMTNQIPPPAHHQYQAHGAAPPPPPSHQPPPLINLPIHLQPEFRVYEMNRRLASRNDNLVLSSRHPQHDPNYCYMWYDSFVNEFFDDNARLNIRNVQEENLTKNYSLSRALIPRFFRSFSEDECTELNFQILRGHIINISNTPSHQQIILYESDLCIMNCKIGRPVYAKLCVEGNLLLECVVETSMPQAPAGSVVLEPIRIKNFTFTIRRHQELIPRSAFCGLRDNNQLDKLSANITKTGLGQNTMKYLKICSVLEPMQELMIRQKTSALSPRECLKSWAMYKMNSRQMGAPINSPAQPMQSPMQHFQRSSSMIQQQQQNEEIVKSEKAIPVAPVDNSKSSSKRRKRKPSPNSSPNETKKEPNAKSKKNAANQQQSSSSPVFNFNSQSGYATPGQLGDVMVVGEPSLMGGDFGEEDERLITRLENNQFDSIVNQMPNMKQSQFVQQRPGSFGDESRQQMMPPRPQSTSLFVNSNLPDRSLTPSPSTSNLAPKTPTPSTLASQNQMVDLNLNGGAGTASAASSSKSPSINTGGLANGPISQAPQAPSTSTSTSAIASSSASLSPNSLFNSSNTAPTNSANTASVSPGQIGSNKQAQLNSGDQSQQNQQQTSQQQQQKGIFLANF